MDFSEYQKRAAKTAIYSRVDRVTYPTLGLCGESGEVAEKVKKVIRDKHGFFYPPDKEEIAKELGDVLWYLAAICRDLELDLNDVAEMNLQKLEDRASRGALQGNGDQR